MTQALFPISVDSRVFGSGSVVAAVEAGLRPFSRVIFLVADEIQVYNDVAKLGGDEIGWGALDWSGRYRSDLSQRKQWLRRLRNKLSSWPRQQRWSVIGVGSLTDDRAYHTLRSVFLLFALDKMFRRDVEEAAHVFASTRRMATAPETLLRLSRCYIIEEVALNVRLRVARGIKDEFYMGESLRPLVNLYAGRYLKSPFELAGVKRKYDASQYRIHRYDPRRAVWSCIESANDGSTAALGGGVIHFPAHTKLAARQKT